MNKKTPLCAALTLTALTSLAQAATPAPAEPVVSCRAVEPEPDGTVLEAVIRSTPTGYQAELFDPRALTLQLLPYCNQFGGLLLVGCDDISPVALQSAWTEFRVYIIEGGLQGIRRYIDTTRGGVVSERSYSCEYRPPR
jgi:hypothetical protein